MHTQENKREVFVYQTVVIAVLLLFPVWKIFDRAGLNPKLSLTLFIPFVGMLVAGLILALSEWKLNANSHGEK